MFIHQTHLEQVLAPESYHCGDHYQREIESLFVPGWHLACALDELPSEGDFITAELFGRPLIIWRKEGEPRAFINVCAHRFSTLTNMPCGNADRLKCQYHGWEYDQNGHTRKIPDAASFRPLEDGSLGLRPIRSERCGRMLFVSFADDPPPLDQYLGDAYGLCQEFFGAKSQLNLNYGQEVAANWKLVAENALESYHVECVHTATFQQRPPADTCTHQLEDGWTSFLTVAPPPKGPPWIELWVHRILGHPYVEEYWNYIFYPNLMLGRAKMFTWALVPVPLSPTRTRLTFRMFLQPGPSRSLRAKMVRPLLKRTASRRATVTLGEDIGALECVQRGVESPVRPTEGLISIREERVHHFQQYVADHVTSGH